MLCCCCCGEKCGARDICVVDEVMIKSVFVGLQWGKCRLRKGCAHESTG